MNANKVYESVIKLLFNVVRNDELKYHLYKNKKYLAKFVNLVNDLLKLEIDEEATYKDQQWAKTFGKAIVIISQEKQRIQISEKKVDQIYEDYSEFISFTNNEYKINNLDSTSINFSQQDVLDDAKLSQDKIAYYDERENEKELQTKAEQEQKEVNEKSSQEKSTEKSKGVGAAGGFNANNNSTNQQGAFNPFANTNLQDLPLPPMADPRFYPYNKKQKWFPAVKIALGVIAIIFTLFLAIVPIFVMANPINFPDDVGLIGGWIIKDDLQEKLGGTTIGEIKGTLTLLGTGVASLPAIINLILLAVFGGFISYTFLRKPRVIKEKYRISYWPLIGLLIVVSLNISLFYNLLNPHDLLKGFWSNVFKAWVAKDQFNADQFNNWWSSIETAKNLDVLQGLAIAGLVFSIMLILGIVGVSLAQPRLDHEKINYANNEYQMAVSAAMQGQKYEMDPSLFDNDDEIVINKKSKFKLWLEKISKKKKKK